MGVEWRGGEGVCVEGGREGGREGGWSEAPSKCFFVFLCGKQHPSRSC